MNAQNPPFRPALLVFLLAFVVHAPSIRNQFALDDLVRITENVDVRTLKGGFSGFFTPMFPGNLYRPLVTMSHSLLYSVVEYQPALYHLFNVTLHAANGALVFSVLFLLAGAQIALLTAVIFAVHPLHVEAVANVSGLSELLGNFFGLCALLVVLKISAKTRTAASCISRLSYLGITALFVCAFLSKESSVCYAALILLAAYFFPSTVSKKIAMLSLVCFSTALALYLIFRVSALGSILGHSAPPNFIDNPLVVLHLFPRVLSSFILIGKYTSLIVAPDILSADYSYAHLLPAASSFDIRAALYCVIFLCCITALILGIKTRSPYSFYLLWFFAGFIATANIFFPIGTIFAERLAYLPSVGIIAICVQSIFLFTSKRIRAAFVLLVTVVLAARTILQSRIWYDNYTLHTYQIRTSPESVKTQLNYAVVLKNMGELRESEEHLKLALKIYPDFTEAFYALAVVNLKREEFSSAEHLLQEAIRRNPRHLEALTTLGRLYFKQELLQLANDNFSKALDFDPNYFPAQSGMLGVLMRNKNLVEARLLRDKLLTRDPQNGELKALSEILDRMLNVAK